MITDSMGIIKKERPPLKKRDGFGSSHFSFEPNRFVGRFLGASGILDPFDTSGTAGRILPQAERAPVSILAQAGWLRNSVVPGFSWTLNGCGLGL